MSRRLRIIFKISRCRCAGAARRDAARRARRRSAAGARHAARAGRLVRHRRLGGRRSRRRLRHLPDQLQSVPRAASAARDSRPIHQALREVCRRAAAAGALANDKAKARAFFEENFRPVRIAKLGETTGLAHRLLRADRRRLALSRTRNSPRRSTGGRAICWSAARRRQRPRCPTGRASAASTPRSRSSPISIAAPSRTARSTASSSRSPGSRIPGRR